MDKQKIEKTESDSIYNFLRGITAYSTENAARALNENNAQDDNDEVKFKEFLALLINDKWWIISITAVILFFGIAKAILDEPVYKLDALLKVEATPNSLGDIEAKEDLTDKTIPMQAEIAIIKSRAVMGVAVDELNLDNVVYPNHYSFFGKAIARKFTFRNPNKISSALFGYSEFAWGGEEIKVQFLDVPESWLGKKLTLISGENGRFKVTHSNKQLIVEGEVGTLLNNPIEGKDKPFRLFVSILKARPGTHFTIAKNTRLHAIGSLQRSFSVRELSEKAGILKFTMESEKPDLAMKTVNMIADTYVRLNVEQKSGNAEKTLSLLQDQVVRVKNQLEASTEALNEYRIEKGSIDFNLETQGVLTGVVGLKTQITLLEQKKDELLRGFTSSHPSVITINKQINRLKAQLYSQNKKIKNLPETQQAILRLTRNVEVETHLYTALLNQLQTIKVTKAGTLGDIRIIDYAVMPSAPFKPKKVLIVAVAIVMGLLIGTILSLIRKAMRHGIEDPKIIEKELTLPVYATVPHSNFQQILNTKSNSNEQNEDKISNILALQNSEDSAIESLRSLRTTFHLSFLEPENNTILICGPSPGIGKSFISINLAALLAGSGNTVLLIDADMRKGALNAVLDIYREDGLSDLISNEIEPGEAIRTIEDAGFDFISTGTIPQNPSELLLNERFKDLIKIFNKSYDIVLIDSPPILAVSDASIIGRQASASLMVVKAGEHTLDELQMCIQRLNQNKVSIKGIVFNDLPESISNYGYEKYSY